MHNLNFTNQTLNSKMIKFKINFKKMNHHKINNNYKILNFFNKILANSFKIIKMIKINKYQYNPINNNNREV